MFNNKVIKFNDEQNEAINAGHGTVHVFAGAGTGKTTVLTQRIKFLIENMNIPPQQIVAFTFTNKAAKEMRERLSTIVNEQAAKKVILGTFHSVCLRILRRFFEQAGLEDRKFIICDPDETKTLIEQIVNNRKDIYADFEKRTKEDNETDASYKAAIKEDKKFYEDMKKLFIKDAIEKVNDWKSAGLTIDMVRTKKLEDIDFHLVKYAKVYMAYQDELELRQMLDFNDIIIKVVLMLERNPEFAEALTSKVKYVLVDETQDTDPMQARLIYELAKTNKNLFIVGDEDQSVYSWRGACPDIMSDLKVSNVKEVVLNKNMRSTQEILDPANLVIDWNPRQTPKTLVSTEHGSKVQLNKFKNEFAEASYISKVIAGTINSGKAEPKDIAILFRTKMHMIDYEKSLIKNKIPYMKIGGTNLLDKEEVKDLISFITLALKPKNDLAFRRVFNKSVKGLGAVAENEICKIAEGYNINFYDALIDYVANNKSRRVKDEIKEEALRFSQVLQNINEAYLNEETPYNLIDIILLQTQYEEWLKNNREKDFVDRINNISFIKDFSKEFNDVFDFLQDISLVSDTDEDVYEQNKVKLMTMHSSKGLEFKYVFCPAFEDGIIPNKRAVEEVSPDIDVFYKDRNPWNGVVKRGLFEERCLAHVAFTRAKEYLYVSYCLSRRKRESGPSEFLKEAELIN